MPNLELYDIPLPPSLCFAKKGAELVNIAVCAGIVNVAYDPTTHCLSGDIPPFKLETGEGYRSEAEQLAINEEHVRLIRETWKTLRFTLRLFF